MTCGIMRTVGRARAERETVPLDITRKRSKNGRGRDFRFCSRISSAFFFFDRHAEHRRTPNRARLRFYFLGQSAGSILRASCGREPPRRRGVQTTAILVELCERVIVIARCCASTRFLPGISFFLFPSLFAPSLRRAPRDYRKRSTSLTVADYFPAARPRYAASRQRRSFRPAFSLIFFRACFFIHRSAFCRELIES